MAEARLSAPLPPGSTIGILGSGQLGRMLAVAAARLGLKTHVYCEESGPAFDVATRTTKAAFDDTAALTEFAGAVGAVTYEFENVPIATAQHLARLVPVRPSAKALEVAQDRLVEKQFISALSIPVAPFRAVGDAAELKAAVAHFGAPAILKTRRLGYDGKGQASVQPGADIEAAWKAVGAKPSVLEKRIAFACEISTLVVRSQSGELATYDCPVNTHENGILRRSVVPADLAEADIARARARRADDCRRARLCGRAGGGDVPSRRRRTRDRARDGQRDRAARAQQRPLDHRSLRREPVREPHARRRRLAARLDRAPQQRRDGEPDRRGSAGLAERSPPSPVRACTSTASTRPAPGARWATSRGCFPSRLEAPPGPVTASAH